MSSSTAAAIPELAHFADETGLDITVRRRSAGRHAPSRFRPPLLIHVPTARWCSLAALTSTENFIVFERPVRAQ
jgi:hypothetical protein